MKMPNNLRIASLLLLLITAINANISAQQYSNLWGVNGELWDPETSRLSDFTNVGYMNGDVPIPNWPVGADVTNYGAVPDDGIDDTQAFRDAIAACPDSHAVFIPVGRYTITEKIVITKNNIVLRGEDMYASVIFFPKYLNEVIIQEQGYRVSVEGSETRNTGFQDGFFLMEGSPNVGYGRGIENISFEFREQRKVGVWEYLGAVACGFLKVENSWIRNVYVKNYDIAMGFNQCENISIINVTLDQFAGRKSNDASYASPYGEGGSNGLEALFGVAPRAMHNSLIHNLNVRGFVMQPIDLNEVNNNNVFSQIRAKARTVGYHGGSSKYNLYTDLNTFISTPKDHPTRASETYWGAGGVPLEKGDNAIIEITDDAYDSESDLVFVGYGHNRDTNITDTVWYEKVDPAQLSPANIYLAQLQHVGKSLPEGPPPPIPSPYDGDFFRIIASEDVTPDKEPYTANLPSGSYIKFDLSAISLPTVAKARLRINFGSLAPLFEARVYSVSDDSWSELTMTTANKPAVGSLLDSQWIDATEENRVVELDVTSFLTDEVINGNGIASFYVEWPGTVNISIFSAEGSRPPQLFIERVADPVAGVPSAPKGISSTPMVGNIVLDWDDNPESDVVAYNVYRNPFNLWYGNEENTPYGYKDSFATVVESEFVDVQSAGNWRIGQMDHRYVYHYKITAIDEHGYESPRSLEFVAATLHPSNDPPAFDSVVTLANATARFEYSGNLADHASDTETDQMYFMKVSGPDWLQVELDGTLSGEPGFGDVGTHTFTFQVTAIGGSTTKDIDLTVDAPTDDPAGAPAAPTGFSATADNNVVELFWDSSPEADLYGYRVFRATTSGGYGSEPLAFVRGGNSYTDFDVTNGNSYYYVLLAEDTSNNASAQSAEISIVPSDVPPPAPTNFAAIAGEAQVALDWDDSPAHDFASFSVYRSTTQGDPGTVLQANLTASTYSDTAAVNGTTYYYTVVTIDGTANVSVPSDEASATPVNLQPPAPQNLVATARDGGVLLDWDDSSVADLAQYTIYRTDSSGSYSTPLDQGGTTGFYLDTAVTNGDTYYYVVTILDDGGLESVFSNEASATPMLGITSFTTFIGQAASGAPDNLITTSENWDNGLPLLQNGIISIDAKFDMSAGHENFWILHDAGSLTLGLGFQGINIYDGAIWELNGPLAVMKNVRGIDVSNAQFTLNNGLAELTNNTPDTNVSQSGIVEINGGTMIVGRNLSVRDAGQIVVNGGTLSIGQNFYTNQFSSSGGLFQFNGGTTTATTIDLNKTGAITFGGQKIGSLTFSGGIGSGATFDWLPGTRMSMTAATSDEWAETEWNAGRLTYNNQGLSELGSWATVTASGGLDGTYSFNYDSVTETLSLASVAPLDNTPPAIPTGLVATAGEALVTLDWDDNGEPDIDTYNIYRSETSGSGYALYSSNSTVSDYSDDWATNDVTYYYVVTAVDTSGNESAFSSEVFGTPTDITAPAVPTGLSGLGGDNDVALDWDDNSDADFDYYNIYRSSTSGSGYVLIADNLVESQHVEFQLINGTTYYYVVTAVDTSGNESAFSEESSATPLDFDPPAVPTGLIAVASDSEVELDWADNIDFDFASYSVFRATVEEGSYSEIANGLTSSQYTDSSLTNGVTYYYVLAAVDTWGNESAQSSSPVSATPASGATGITNLVVVDGLLSEVTSWDAGLPVGKQGTIAIDGRVDSNIVLDGYNILHTGGEVSHTGVPGLELTNGSRWVTDGATATTSTAFRAMKLTNGSSFILNDGTINTTNNASWQADGPGSSITINGGTFNLSGNILLVGDAGPVFTITGGTLQGNPASSLIGANFLKNNSKVYNFDGGTTTVYQLDPVGDNTIFNFGGSTAGSVTADSFAGAFGDNTLINFRSGSQMALTLSAEDEWAATLWANGDLMFNGQGVNELGSWALVSTPGGLPNGYSFSYDSVTETLSIATVGPAAPTGLVATGLAASINLDWDDNTEPDFASYLVFRSSTQGSGYASIATGLTESDYSDQTPDAGTTYYYVVRAVDSSSNESEYSAEVMAITDDGDGIPDDWEVNNLGNADSLPSDDTDGDGVANFLEYIYGSLPNDASDRGFALQALRAGSIVTFNWDVAEGFDLGNDYDVEISTDLDDWFPLPENHRSINQNTSNGKTHMELEVTEPSYGNTIYFRLMQPSP